MAKTKRAYLTQAEKCYKLLEYQGLSTDELARRIFGQSDYFAKKKVNSLISKLRRMGIDYYPKGGGGGKWQLPEDLGEHKEAIGWKRSQHFVRFFRFMKFVEKAEGKFAQLKGTKKGLLEELENPDKNDTVSPHFLNEGKKHKTRASS